MNKKIEEAVRELADFMWGKGYEQSDIGTDDAIAGCLAIIEGEMLRQNAAARADGIMAAITMYKLPIPPEAKS